MENKMRLKMQNKQTKEVVHVNVPISFEKGGTNIVLPDTIEEWLILSMDRFTGITDVTGAEVFEKDRVWMRNESQAEANKAQVVHYENDEFFIYQGAKKYYLTEEAVAKKLIKLN